MKFLISVLIILIVYAILCLENEIEESNKRSEQLNRTLRRLKDEEIHQ